MKNYTITISREYGSGGRLIGKKLALCLGIPCYDRSIIQKTSQRSGLSPDFIEQAEERARSRFHMNVTPVNISTSPIPATTHQGYSGVPVNHQAFFAQADVIRELADTESCIIVGRCSDYVLGTRPNCLKIFIRAAMPDRIRRCVDEYDISPDEVEDEIRLIDKGRRNYYHYYTGREWGDMRRHDLCINSSITGIDGAVQLISDFVEIYSRNQEKSE